MGSASRREALEDQAARHEEARRLRRYIDEVEQRAGKQDLSSERLEACRKWLEWAREHADRIDPLSSELPF